jgi:FtsP/CotA-like multicopper oxidase with cupredoxin domain
MFRILYRLIRPLVIVLAVACLPSLAAATPRTSYTLMVTEHNIITANGATIFGWGIQDISSLSPTPITLQSGAVVTPPAADHNAPAGSGVTIPGPVLEFSAGTITINLVNNLASVFQQAPVSLIIPGLLPTTSVRGISAVFPPTTTGTSPVYDTAAPKGTPPVSRVRSFAAEASGATIQTYHFNATGKAGTYLYEDSSTQQVSLQMGVYGAVIIRPAGWVATTNQIAYTGIPYDFENTDANGTPVPYVFGDFDPGINQALIITPAGPFSTTLSVPKYFMINGKNFPQTTDIVAAFNPAAVTPLRTLVRLLNAGSVSVDPTFVGQTLTVIAEDGQPKAVPTTVNNSINIPAGKTVDVIITPTAMGYTPVYDRSLGLINGQIYKDVELPPEGVATFLLADNKTYLGTGLSCSPLKGKANPASQTITINDALHALREAVGLELYNPNLDVAPLDATSGLPCGTGSLGPNMMTSALFILQKAMGANPY